MKKQCNPTKTKSFKERNPDLDLDEIQQNPNVPDDVKAMLKESVLTLHEEDADYTPEEPMSLQSPADFKTKQELLEYMDDGTGESAAAAPTTRYSIKTPSLSLCLCWSFHSTQQRTMTRRRTLRDANRSADMMRTTMTIG